MVEYAMILAAIAAAVATAYRSMGTDTKRAVNQVNQLMVRHGDND